MASRVCPRRGPLRPGWWRWRDGQGENSLHDRRDVTFQRDASPLRHDWTPQVLATRNNTMVSLVARHGWNNRAKAQREVAYGWLVRLPSERRNGGSAEDFALPLPTFPY